MKNKARTLGSKPRFTGKKLVKLNPEASHTSISSKARTASLRLAGISDFGNKIENFRSAFEEADGIIFEEFGVAVVNEESNRKVSMLTSATATRNTFLYSEPERYVYAISPAKKSAVKNKTYKDDKKAMWGVHATGIFDSKFTGRNIRLAILDTGFYLKHADFKGRNIKSKSFINGEAVNDGNGHGSHCTGVSCGNINKKTKTRYGTALAAEIYIGKVLSNEGSGTDAGILAGMEWAMQNKCRIISMSLGAEVRKGEKYSDIYEEIAKKLNKNGAIIIAAAGNESHRRSGKISPVGHPANCPSIMAVAALDSSLKVADFSCGGINKNGGQVDIAAPGVDIYSSWVSPEKYNIISGTSMATPFTAGIAALYWEESPDATPSDIWMYLIQNARRLDLRSSDVGAGLVQAPFKK